MGRSMRKRLAITYNGMEISKKLLADFKELYQHDGRASESEIKQDYNVSVAE